MSDQCDGKFICAGCDAEPAFAAAGPNANAFVERVFKEFGWHEHAGYWWCPKCASSPIRRIDPSRRAANA